MAGQLALRRLQHELATTVVPTAAAALAASGRLGMMLSTAAVRTPSAAAPLTHAALMGSLPARAFSQGGGGPINDKCGDDMWRQKQQWQQQQWQQQWQRDGRRWREDRGAGRVRSVGPIKREALVLKNGIIGWWGSLKEAWQYARIISLPPGTGVGVERGGVHPFATDPFPKLTTLRDARYLSELFADAAKGVAAAAVVVSTGGGAFLLAAVNYLWPALLPSSFAASRRALMEELAMGNKPQWSWRPAPDNGSDATTGAGAGTTSSGAGGAGGAAGPTNAWSASGTGSAWRGGPVVSNAHLVQSLSEAQLASLARTVVGAGPVGRLADEPDITDGDASHPQYGYASLGTGSRISRFAEELPKLLSQTFQFPNVTTAYIRRALARGGSEGVGGSTTTSSAVATAELRQALVEYFDKVQFDDALLRAEARGRRGIFAPVPGVDLARFSEADLYVRPGKGDVRYFTVGTLPPLMRRLSEIAYVADQRLVRDTLARGARGGGGAGPTGSVTAADLLEGTRTWLDASVSTPVAQLYLQAAEAAGDSSLPRKA